MCSMKAIRIICFKHALTKKLEAIFCHFGLYLYVMFQKQTFVNKGRRHALFCACANINEGTRQTRHGHSKTPKYRSAPQPEQEPSEIGVPSARMRSEGTVVVCVCVCYRSFRCGKCACGYNNYANSTGPACSVYLEGTRSHNEGRVSTPACYLLL